MERLLLTELHSPPRFHLPQGGKPKGQRSPFKVALFDIQGGVLKIQEAAAVGAFEPSGVLQQQLLI